MACVNARIGQRSAWTVWVPLLVVAALVVSLWWWTGHRSTKSLPRPTSIVATPDSRAATPASGLATIEESRLPSQARDTLALIRDGGPYPYRQDDGVFGNREGLLPRQPSGYYREYTVVTPGSDDRGPRRIISGADGDRYWTADHYASFRQIKEGR
ncbi:MAG: ribonuclease domain-containing protein [Dermatophilaceae bacterium]